MTNTSRTINSSITLSVTTIITVLALTGCQTMTTGKAVSNNSMTSNPLTAQMPVIDRQGRIAYVEEQGVGAAKISTLYSISPDGSDRRLIDQLNGYIYAPAWSADGQHLAYSKQPARHYPFIYIYDRSKQSSELVVDAKGSNLSPSFSPDGLRLLYSSSVGGNADIYERSLTTGITKQLTTLSSTEVQPSYAPDGQSFVYVSDKVRSGRPSIYRYTFATGNAALLSANGYAASPQLSLDGQLMSYLNGRQAAVITLANKQVVNLAETGLDEPARFSPSAQYVVYAMQNSKINGQTGSSLVVRSLASGSSYIISSKLGNSQSHSLVRSPVWGR
ncbi:Xaa-Pro aminopeptidase [Psychrobacter sp. M13]|uniref:Xaa-Pro aminopeptidase n=1 Tax=Psychrobacter sp. M13 TaxID=3067275 RepID=UPI00273CE882|nr:Xaa-Pro aminopeptidase [Psychrobacter sp. M13]WLP95016.1 Xaa-Pro aminopeptidase [Psychrobacter sp. M13]